MKNTVKLMSVVVLMTASAAFAVPVCIDGSNVLVELKGLGGCPCVAKGKCAEYTTPSNYTCGLATDYNHLCEIVFAGPAELDSCGSGGSDPAGTCRDVNGENGADDPDCYLVSTGRCEWGPLWLVTTCEVDEDNVPRGGKGKVYDGPGCPKEE